jgi:hypothetical protein
MIKLFKTSDRENPENQSQKRRITYRTKTRVVADSHQKCHRKSADQHFSTDRKTVALEFYTEQEDFPKQKMKSDTKNVKELVPSKPTLQEMLNQVPRHYGEPMNLKLF